MVVAGRRPDGDEVLLLDDDYRLGTVFEVKIVAQPSGIYVRFNGGEKRRVRSGTYSGCFYKAGVYVQSSTNNKAPFRDDRADAYGEFVIHELEVSHR